MEEGHAAAAASLFLDPVVGTSSTSVVFFSGAEPTWAMPLAVRKECRVGPVPVDTVMRDLCDQPPANRERRIAVRREKHARLSSRAASHRVVLFTIIIQ